jgi:hypothetical protein
MVGGLPGSDPSSRIGAHAAKRWGARVLRPPGHEAIPPWRPTEACEIVIVRDPMRHRSRPIWATAEGRAMLAIYAAQVAFLAGLGFAFTFLVLE